MPERPLLCLGEAWVELTAETAPELAEVFRAGPGGWAAEFCLKYAAQGGHAVLLSQLGADPFGRKLAAYLAAHDVDCSGLAFTEMARTPVVFSGTEGEPVVFRNPSAELLYAPEQLETAIFREAFGFCFSSACLLDAPIRMTHLKAIAAARTGGALVCYAPRMAQAAPFWPDEGALRETAQLFFPQADVLLLEKRDLQQLLEEEELRPALFSLFTGHVQLIFYAAEEKCMVLTRNAMAGSAQSGLTGAEFLHRLQQLQISRDELPRLSRRQLEALLGKTV